MKILRKANEILEKTLGVRITRKRVATARRSKNLNKPKTPVNLEGLDINSYLKDLDDAFRSSLLHPGFLETDARPSPLVVTVGRQTLAVRIDLPTSENLHLHSIVLTDENEEKIHLGNDAIVTTSSRHADDTHSNYQRKKLLSKLDGKHKVAIHTRKEKNPWIIIVLPEQKYVKTITINNVQGQTSLRAAGMRVASTLNLDTWVPLYDIGGVSNYFRKVTKIARKYDIHSYESGDAILNFTRFLVRGYGHPLKSLYKRIPEYYKKTLRKSVNDVILNDRKVAWTGHGLQEPFKFYSLEDKRSYIRDAEKVIKDLKGLSSSVCLGFGSVLAAVRDKDLLPHDDDMDIIIAFEKSQAPTIHQAMQLLDKQLEDKGYSTRETRFNHYFVTKNSRRIDVFVGIYENDDTIGWFPGKRGALNRRDMFPSKNTKLLGVNCAIPANPEKYLASIYGPGWKTPDPHYVHTWSDKSEYQDIAGK